VTSEGVSTFEFLCSGLIDTLIEYFIGEECNDFQSITRMPSTLQVPNYSLCRILEARARLFCNIFLSTELEGRANEEKEVGSVMDNAFLVLVRKLQHSLNILEKFPVLLNELPGTVHGLKFLTQPLKLRLVKKEDTNIYPTESIMVLIEPLATVKGIIDYLSERIQASSPTYSRQQHLPTMASSELIEQDFTRQERERNAIETRITRRRSASKPKDSYENTSNEKRAAGSWDSLETLQKQPGSSENQQDFQVPNEPEISPFSKSSMKMASTRKAFQLFISEDEEIIRDDLHHRHFPLSSSLSSSSSSLHLQPLLPEMSIFQALQQEMHNRKQNTCASDGNGHLFPVHRIWERVHTIFYATVSDVECFTDHLSTGSLLDEVSKDNRTSPVINTVNVEDSTYIRCLRQLFPFSCLSSSFSTRDQSNQIDAVFLLLKILFQFNALWTQLCSEKACVESHCFLSPMEFINSKINAKLIRQLEDPLTLCSSALPEWCRQLAIEYHFLFPFESRRLLFSCSSFGIARALQTMEQYMVSSGRGSGSGSHSISSSNGGLSRNGEFRIGRIPRQKVRIARSKLLESAVKVMSLYGRSKAILEVEYFGEVGTGLGPTLEFYTLVSRELQKEHLKLWRNNPSPSSSASLSLSQQREEEEKKEHEINAPMIRADQEPDFTQQSISEKTESSLDRYVYCSGGLFPTPIRPSDPDDSISNVLEMFQFIGCFIAKALLDGRLIDLPLSRPFLKWMTGFHNSSHSSTVCEFSLEDLKMLDEALGSSLEKLMSFVYRKRLMEMTTSLDEAALRTKIEDLRLDQSTIEDLSLDFTLPGRPDWELKRDGSNIAVSLDNLEEYIHLVLRQHMVDGVVRQMTAFRRGFCSVFPIENLSVLTVEELEVLLCGSEQTAWDMTTLIDNTRCDHGYTHSSPTVKYLLEIMTELNAEEQRKFLLFVTGSPRLPLGGFQALEPKLTVVRKEPTTSGESDPDSYLPSVNCCFYYLKLPEYSSKSILKERLLFAIENGQGAFSFN